MTGRGPMVQDGRIFGLDTGACHGGNLTVLCVPEFAIYLVGAHADHWSAVKRRWQAPVLRAKPWRDYAWTGLDAVIEGFARQDRRRRARMA